MGWDSPSYISFQTESFGFTLRSVVTYHIVYGFLLGAKAEYGRGFLVVCEWVILPHGVLWVSSRGAFYWGRMVLSTCGFDGMSCGLDGCILF